MSSTLCSWFCLILLLVFLFSFALFTDGPKKSCSGKTGGQQGRSGINLLEDRGLDLVFVFDASVSRYYFQTRLEFAKELLRVIGASKRYPE